MKAMTLDDSAILGHGERRGPPAGPGGAVTKEAAKELRLHFLAVGRRALSIWISGPSNRAQRDA
jgi:hypothetical protein